MLLVMAISLYTSRVVLHTLGVDDYGTYQVVGGVVGLLSFLNVTLSTGTSRFLLFELGKGDFDRLKDTFSTMLSAHIILAIIVVILAETVGLWFVYNKLNIQASRMDAAVFVYHISVFTAVLSLTQTPYSASIKSHERMDVYAYTSIIDVSAKLLVVYLLTVSPMDKLKFYALCLALVRISMNLYYRYFCVKHFKECRYRISFNKLLFRNITSYCGWNLLSKTSNVLNAQGVVILLNMFFNPAMVTSMSIATTVKNAANSFVENYRLAAVPQIVKSLAAGNVKESQQLLLSNTRYSFYLFLLLGIPIYLCAEEILQLWLGLIPENSVIFLLITIISCVFSNLTGCFYTALDAKGTIKEYSIIFPCFMFAVLPVTYIFFKLFHNPTSAVIIMLVSHAMVCLLVMPALVVRIAQYKLSDVLQLYISCLKITVLALPIPVIFHLYFKADNNLYFIAANSIVSILSSSIVIWIFGIPRETRDKILKIVYQRLHK